MATGYNQYIGMRYVPLIDGSWSSTKNYEPLVLVSYEGNSYISKTFVPAGTLPTNETYWMLSANYNVQVEQYRQEVRQYQGTVDGVVDTVDGITEDITEINTALEILEDAQLLLAEAAISVTYSGTVQPTYSATLSGTNNLSNNTRVRKFKQLRPNSTLIVATLGGAASWGNLETLQSSIVESGSIAGGDYVCTVSANGRWRNMSNVDQTNPTGTIRALVIGSY